MFSILQTYCTLEVPEKVDEPSCTSYILIGAGKYLLLHPTFWLGQGSTYFYIPHSGWSREFCWRSTVGDRLTCLLCHHKLSSGQCCSLGSHRHIRRIHCQWLMGSWKGIFLKKVQLRGFSKIFLSQHQNKMSHLNPTFTKMHSLQLAHTRLQM